MAMKNLLRYAVMGLALLAWSATPGLAQDAAAPATQEPAQAAEEEPEIEPAALAAVKQMGEFLRSLQDVEFEARTTRDEVLESGQLIKTRRCSPPMCVRPRACGSMPFPQRRSGNTTTTERRSRSSARARCIMRASTRLRRYGRW